MNCSKSTSNDQSIHYTLQGAEAKFARFEFSRNFESVFQIAGLKMLQVFAKFPTFSEMARKFKVYNFASAPCARPHTARIQTYLNSSCQSVELVLGELHGWGTLGNQGHDRNTSMTTNNRAVDISGIQTLQKQNFTNFKKTRQITTAIQ